jgi:preprotein translocase subunit SecD
MGHPETQNKEGSERLIRTFRALVVMLLGVLLGYFAYVTTKNSESEYPFVFGLDLAGGSQLVYVADTTEVAPSEVGELMSVLREVIERRVNSFGVSEPNVQVETSSFVTDNPEQRLIVELPGVTDIDEAIKQIGQTPLLEFKLVDQEALAAEQAALTEESNPVTDPLADPFATPEEEVNTATDTPVDPYVETGLTGRYLKRAELVFGQSSGGGLSNEPIVSITFNDEGAALFESITRENTGELLAIFLDGQVVSAPQINEPIVGGQAIISGNFTVDEARELVRNLNFGALPVPIALDSTQTIGGALGEEALHAGVRAGVIGFVLLSLFMIVWYRVPGVIAVLALIMYVIMMLALFKLIPVVLTAAGIAGLILSIGLAVDANILIAERIKEELRAGKTTEDAIKAGFDRAWLAIRDSNIAHIIAGVILFWFGTALIKGFALVFSVGVIVSMISAISISRTLLIILPLDVKSRVGRFFMSSGISR